MPVGVGKNVCQTVLLFDGLSFHSFLCNYTVFLYVSVHLSVYQFEYCLSMCPSVCPSARLNACFCDIVCSSIGLYVYFLLVRPSDRPSVLSSSVSMNACL